jgi:chromosome segregation ATPase
MESNSTKSQFDSLTQTIGALRAQVAELQVQNELLEYRLERSERARRDLEREVQEHRAYWGTSRIPDFSQSVYDPRGGWGKGKDE